MPRDGGYLLSDYGGEPLSVLCEECQLFKSISTAELMIEHGDCLTLVLVDHIAAKIVGCKKKKDGTRDRCSLVFYNRPGSPIAKLTDPKEFYPKIVDIRNWEVVVAKCKFCGHVSNIPHWKLRSVANVNMTTQDLGKRLKCKNCTRKGDVSITIAKMPR